MRKSPAKKESATNTSSQLPKTGAKKERTADKKKHKVKKNTRKNPLMMKADDQMPWGKYLGESLRSVYQMDIDYFNMMVGDERYEISDRTIEIIKSNIPEFDHTEPTFSKGARLDKTEYKENDLVHISKEICHSLEEVFMNNESYYRYFIGKPDVYVSRKTFEKLMIKKYGEESVRYKTREELNEEIIRSINGFDFSDLDDYSRENLDPYIGKPITPVLSDEMNRIVERAKKTDAFGLKKSLKQIFGKGAEFREGQQEAILAVLNGKKMLVVQHTGWGKSLVYFMAIKKLREMGAGPAIIISPLLALMHNQIESTAKFDLDVRAISSDSKDEWKRTYADYRKGEVDALIISPERLGNEQFEKFMEDELNKVSLFVIDEAHCISDWGHDFRPDFRRILKYIRRLPEGTPVLATTATANDRVVRDIRFQLGQDLEIVRGTMDRKSILIDVLDLKTDREKMKWLLRNLPKLQGNGIVYCLTIRDCEEVVEILQEYGINAEIYHGRLNPEQKVDIERRFQENRIKVLVATIAFGMGIDKPDIAFVIHYQQPASVIAYYQQIGRAGRAIDKSYAILLAGDEDNSINRYFIMNAFPTENEMEKVVDCVIENPGISRSEIMEICDKSMVWADKVINYLLVNGDIYRKNHRYYKTSKEWTCDMKRARIVSWYRWRELRRFNEYIETKSCYMSFIRHELDDTNIRKCGRCANCLGQHFFK